MRLLRNSLIIKIRQLITRASAQLLVMSHRPFRKKLISVKTQLVGFVVHLFRRYMRSSLWIRSAIALGLLMLTASSSYVFIALLIIPQPLVNWVKRKLTTTLNKLGITQAFNAIWRYFVPASWQTRWHIYQKWTLGRRQIKAARQMHNKFSDIPPALAARDEQNHPTG